MNLETLKPEEGRVQPWYAINGDASLRLNYPLNKSSLVYDVGGYLGEWAEPIYKRFHCQIEIFEPVGKFTDSLQKKFKDNPKIHIYPFALGSKNRKSKISLEDASSSIFKASQKSPEIKIVAAASVIPVDTTIDLMKINIEGGEYELLEHLIEVGLVKNIVNIQVQFHIFAPNAKVKREDLHQKLAKTHDLTYSYPWIWENWRRK